MSLIIFQSTQPEWAATSSAKLRKKNMKISIHAARVGCDISAMVRHGGNIIFQSTQPEWAATAGSAQLGGYYKNFNPRSPSGLRPKMKAKLPTHKKDFNPRSPSGLRLFSTKLTVTLVIFQSTQPEWAATV